jgi:hypothetical protein
LEGSEAGESEVASESQSGSSGASQFPSASEIGVSAMHHGNPVAPSRR